ncbi:MAG: Do family serine endopeptidase [Gammaproteobacteria bacterium]|nr:Do family serine endopeptidase [Gammaproteobacteria bacterium]
MTRYLSICIAFLLCAPLAAELSLPDFSELAERAAPTVVNISVVNKVKKQEIKKPEEFPHNIPWEDVIEKFMPPEHTPQPNKNAVGSGFIISADGEIISNYHVVKDAEQIIVKLNDRREMHAEVVGFDELSDVVLLKIDAENLPTVTIGSSELLKVGQWVLAIGAPFGFDYTVTAGIVSAKGRSLPDSNYVPFLQTDVAINPGNSGGPLFNLDGEVVGINSQIYSRTGSYSGLSFAVPIDLVLDIVGQLKDTGAVARGWLGIYIQEITGDLSESFNLDRPIGALVSRVIEDSPAQKAGIEVGDIVLRFNDIEITSSSMLPPLVGSVSAGEEAIVEVLRDDENLKIEVMIEQLPSDKAIAMGIKEKTQSSKILGMTLAELSSEQREKPSLKDGGLIVADIEKGDAEQAGVQKGDILIMLDNQRFETIEQFEEIIDELPRDRFVALLVIRSDENPLFIALKLSD